MYNASVHVTGLLVLTDGMHYLQTIEGPPDAVDLVYARIVSDTSHAEFAVLCDEKIDQRAYPDWAMMGNDEPCAHALREFLSYALRTRPRPFTDGQNRALEMTLSRLAIG
jgi:hypothetical protein